MKKTILIYGFISGGISAVVMLVSALFHSGTLDFKYGEIIGYSSILLSMLFVYFGIRSFRDKVRDGIISFSKAFQVGILITVISCLCYVITWLFVYHFIMPDFMDQYAAHMLEKMRMDGASLELIQEKSQEMDQFKAMYQNPLLRFGLTFLEPFPVGVLVTVVSAAVLRKHAA